MQHFADIVSGEVDNELTLFSQSSAANGECILVGTLTRDDNRRRPQRGTIQVLFGRMNLALLDLAAVIFELENTT